MFPARSVRTLDVELTVLRGKMSNSRRYDRDLRFTKPKARPGVGVIWVLKLRTILPTHF